MPGFEDEAVEVRGAVTELAPPLAPVGRESELPGLERFLVGARAALVLALCGDPGIGKTTLWEAGIALATERGVTVLSARASEAEAQLSFAALADLLDRVDPALLDELPQPQRYALEVAVRRTEPSGAVPEPFAISAGFLGARRLLAGRGPVLVAIDDVLWLDPASAAVLSFAARRLRSESVRYLVSRRPVRRSDLERALEPEVDRLELGPLSIGAISRLLRERLGQPLPRRVLRQVFETSGGNPLFALELGRALLEQGLPEIGAALPVPQVLEELFGARVAALPAPVRRVLLAVALSASLSTEELISVVAPLAFEDALATGILIAAETRLRASHPLLAAAALRQSSARERRDLHLALAETVTDETLRVRHLAMAATTPDTALAARVSAAATRSTELGAVQDASEFALHALRLTPSDDPDHGARLLALARHLATAGEYPRATELLAERIDSLPAGPARAEAYLLLGEGAELAVEEEHIALAIEQANDDPDLRARALARRSLLLAVNRAHRLADAERMASDAVAIARSAAPDVLRRALVALAWVRIMRGKAVDDLLERSAHMPPITSSLYDTSVERPAGVRFAFRGELARSREVLQRLLACADQRGESRSGVICTFQLCEVEMRAGDVHALTRALHDWAQWNALEPEAPAFGTRAEAVLAALRGDARRATELSAACLERAAPPDGSVWDQLEARRATGLVALLERDPEKAVASIEPVWEHMRREGIDDPGTFPVAGDLVEALAELGRLERARAVIEWLEPLAVDQQHPWGLATVTRSKAVIELTERYDEAAAAQLARSADDYRALGLGFDCARTLLLLGRTQRRFKKRAAARQSLEQARATFAQLGCVGWSELAGSELARVSGRTAAATGELTASERRVAELVRAGHSNKEVAAQLFVTVHTVEAHLSNVYAKLGIRSRTQLARHLDDSA